MTFLLLSFVAGVLTVLAPCILPMLPIIVGGTLAKGGGAHRAYVVIGSLAASLFLFTMILKVSTIFIVIPELFWKYASGGIIVFIGITFLFSKLWISIIDKTPLGTWGNRTLGRGFQQNDTWGDIIMGGALGPVFATCSPTYFVIIATVLPASFAKGIIYLMAYIIGVVTILLFITVFGDRILVKFNILANPRGGFKKIIGVVFILVGIAIITGFDRRLEAKILRSENFFDVTKIEYALLGSDSDGDGAPETVDLFGIGKSLPEIIQPDGFINTSNIPITLSQYRNRKVVLVDFWSYTCTDCGRTIPYLNALYQKYGPYGLEIIGVHTPEFQFEQDIDRVRSAVQALGISYPVVLDNSGATMASFGSDERPHKYIIDMDGSIVYDNIGDDSGPEMEALIQKLLRNAGTYQGQTNTIQAPAVAGQYFSDTEPVYMGSDRNNRIANIKPLATGVVRASLPSMYTPDTVSLEGLWDITPQYAMSMDSGRVIMNFAASRVSVIAGSSQPTQVQVYIDGKYVRDIEISDYRIYTLADYLTPDRHTLELRTGGSTELQLFVFRFG